MEKLAIGDVIHKLRKEKGITQEQLANFIGVSTAAVSKWESGISYPDITLLPVIATFFNVSIDRLLNFQVELTDEEVMEIFRECEKLFAVGELEKGIEKSKKIISKYPHSYYLKLRMGFLFNMYSWKAKDHEEGMKMICDSIELFEDVANNCHNVDLVEQALFQLGALYPMIEEEEKAVDALNRIRKSQLDPHTLLANIYIEQNEYKKAREILQSRLFKAINDISLICQGLANSYMKEKRNIEIVERYYSLAINVKKAITLNGHSSISLANEFLNFALAYLKYKEEDKALDILEKMVEDIKINDINGAIKFSSIWCFNEIPEGEPTITMNLYENIFKILQGPGFDLIRDREEFINMIRELKELEEKSLYQNRNRVKERE